MLNPDQIQQLGQLPPANRQKLPLAPGDDVQGTSWKNLKNLRLRVRGNNVFWVARGGSTLVNSFFGNILTIRPIDARVGATLTEYIVVHTSAGKVYLWDIDGATSTEIAASGFSTTDQIQIENIGRFVYLFDYDGGATKVWDLAASVLYDYGTYNKAYIHTKTFLSDDLEPDVDNIYGFRLGSDIVVFPNKEFTASSQVFTSSGLADGTTSSFDPALWNENSFFYTYDGGKYLQTSDGIDLKESQFLTFTPDAGKFGFTVKGSGSDFTIDRFYIPLDEDGAPSFLSYRAKITNIGDQIISWEDPTGVEQSTVLGGYTAEEALTQNLVFPWSADLETLVGRPTRYKLSTNGQTIEENSLYTEPSIYRQYVVFDLLEDGSVTVLGLPQQVEIDYTDLLVNGSTRVSLTVTTPDANVAERYLCATRWQDTPELAFDTSRPEYPNSPLFIIGAFTTSETIFRDRTPDRRLVRPIVEFIPMSAGVMDLFGPGEIRPNSVARFRNSLMQAGYCVERPIPTPYTDPSAETDGNIYVNLTSTTQLANNMALAFMFEYSDGRRSNIVETEEFLQDNETTGTVAADCDQVKGTASHSLTNGVDYDGDIIVNYDGYDLTVSLTVASHASAADAAEALRAAIQADPDIQISASITTTPQIDYEEERFGENFNGNAITYTDVPPWDVGGTVFNDSFATGVAAPEGLAFNNDGTKMFVIRNSNDRLREYDLSTAYDVTTAVYSGNFFSVGTQDSEPRGVVFNDDGTKFFILGSTNDTIYEYTVSTGFDLASTVAYSGNSFSIAGQTTGPEGIACSPDGTKFYVIDNTDIYMFECSTGFDITTMGFTSGDSFSVSTQTSAASGVEIHTDGSKVIITDDTTLYEYDLSTDFEINTASYSGTSFDHSATTTTSTSLVIDNNGTKLYLLDDSSGNVYEFDLPSGIGITFDSEPITISGASDPDGTAAKFYLWMALNGLSSGSQTCKVTVDGVDSDTWTVDPGDTTSTVHARIQTAINTAASTLDDDWTATIETVEIDGVSRSVVVVTAPLGDESFNDLTATIDFGTDLSLVYKMSAPGRFTTTNSSILTNGASAPCTSAEAYFDVSANGLGGGATEDHTLTLDGDSTPAITIADTDTTEQIVDKYIAAIQADESIDRLWKATKEDQGGGTWRLIVQYRQHGTAFNGLVVSIAGDTAVTVSVTSPTAGGTDAGTVPDGTGSTIEANKVQFHSLNALIDKVFVLGRTTGGGTTYHLIEQYNITDPRAQGMEIVLPGTTEELDEIELNTFEAPTGNQVLESVNLINYVNVGTPAQQFSISTQEEIVDESKIIKAIPMEFDVDKSTMRFRVAIFTEQNIQVGYLVDTAVQGGRIFEGDFEIILNGEHASNRFGIHRKAGLIMWPTNDSVYVWDGNNAPQRIFDRRRYSVSENNELIDISLNEKHNELWMAFRNAEVLVYDLDTGTTRRYEYSSNLGPVRAITQYQADMYIGCDTDLIKTDIESAFDDVGETIACTAETDYVGDELSQMRLLDVTVGGQAVSLSVDLDYQEERFIDVGTGWQDDFEADESKSAQTLNMAGRVYTLYRYAIMPRLRLNWNPVSGGFLSHVILKYIPTRNDGQARE